MSRRFLVVFLVLQVMTAEGARILGLFPHPGKSHFDVFQVLMEALADRGHNVTVVSFFPHNNPPPRYHDISLVGLQPIRVNNVNFEDFESSIPEFLVPYLMFYPLAEMGLDTCRAVLPSAQIKSLLESKDSFDLVIMEQFQTDCFLGVVHKLQVPFMAMSSCALLPWLHGRFGNPAHPAYVPNVLLGKSDRMGLLDRVQNLILDLVTSALYYPVYEAPAQKLVQRYIGDTPPLREIAKNTSLMLVNTHFSLHHPSPVVPAVVEIGGIHVRPPKPLPKDLDKFLSEAPEGALVFSLGSTLNAETLAKDKIDAFLGAFRSIPQRVVWKIGGNLSHVPENVLVMPWIPQKDILAHPNVRAFIAHGGLLGLTEARVFGKPVVAIPMFGDQPANVRAAVQAGIAVELPYKDITEAAVLRAITTVLSLEYKQRALKLSKIFNDRPIPPLDLAVYWTEYVLRYGGSNLRSAAVELSTVQYYLLDVLAVLLLSICASVYIAKTVLFMIINVLRRKLGKKIKKQ